MSTEAKHTAGPWRAIALGGSSTVVTPAMPVRNDRRSEVPYGYRDGGEYCVGFPFLYQSEPGKPGESTRMDFVCFSHADARLMAAAPELLAALKAVVSVADRKTAEFDAARAAIAKAESAS